jgi:hypothetical protein
MFKLLLFRLFADRAIPNGRGNNLSTMGWHRLDRLQFPGSGLTYVPQTVRHPEPRAQVQQEHHAPNAQKHQHRKFIESVH